MFFILPEELFLFLRYLNFCPDFFVHLRKRLGKKAGVNFKILDETNWKANDYNIHTAQYLNLVKSGQLMEYSMRNIFIKSHAEKEAERLVTGLFLFFKKTLYEVKASGQHLSFNKFC